MGFTDKILSTIGLQKKSVERPEYGRGYSPFYVDDMRYGYAWNQISDFTYRNEVGRLDNSSLVMAVVNWTATQLPEAIPVVQKPGKDNSLEPDWGNPAADIIRRPTPFDVWADVCGALSVSWWIDGNVYFYEARDTTGQVVELWYIPHFLIEERWPGDGRSPEVPTTGPNKAQNDYLSHYQYSVPNKEPILWQATDVIHLKRGKDLNNPRRGIGAFEPVIREIYGDNKAAQFSATILKNMGIVVPILSPKDKEVTIDASRAAEIEERWVQKTTGHNTGKPIINSIPLDVTKFAFSPQEIDLKELRKVPESRVAAVTGIPAALLQFLVGLENGTSYAAYAEARRQGYESVIIPIQAAIAEQLTWQLLAEFDQTKGARFTFDVSQVRVLQEDRDALYKRAVDALRNGGTSRNQFMASLGKPPVDKDEIYYVPSMATPMTLEKIAEVAADTTPKPEPPVIDPASLAKFADMERMFESLEQQMREFQS
jgi:phage portal protein BeeE